MEEHPLIVPAKSQNCSISDRYMQTIQTKTKLPEKSSLTNIPGKKYWKIWIWNHEWKT